MREILERIEGLKYPAGTPRAATRNQGLDEAKRVIEESTGRWEEKVVRCKECVMWDGSFTLNGQKKCLNMTFCTDGDFYCGWGSKE